MSHIKNDLLSKYCGEEHILEQSQFLNTYSREQVILLTMIFSKCLILIIFCNLSESALKVITNYSDCFNGTKFIIKTDICENIWDYKYAIIEKFMILHFFLIVFAWNIYNYLGYSKAAQNTSKLQKDRMRI